MSMPRPTIIVPMTPIHIKAKSATKKVPRIVFIVVGIIFFPQWMQKTESYGVSLLQFLQVIFIVSESSEISIFWVSSKIKASKHGSS